MLQNYLFANFHFALTVFCALAFFATAWLYMDSWNLDRNKKTPLVRSLGFIFLSISFAMQATSLENSFYLLLIQIAKIAGLIFILTSLMKEPVLRIPKTPVVAFAAGANVLFYSLAPLATVLYLLIGLTYFRKATEGLEKQLRPAGFAFLFLALSEFLSIFFFLKDTSNVFWSKILADYGIVFNISHILFFAGVLILFVWTFGYLRFRLQAQLFIVTLASSLIIFLATTFIFTFLLLRNLENDALSHLKTDVNILHYAIERVQYEALADARAVAQDSSFQKALEDGTGDDLFKISQDFLISQQTSFLTITDPSGEVVMRAEDKENIGDSVSDNKIFLSAVGGSALSTVSQVRNQINPQILIQAGHPVKNSSATSSGRILGTVLTGFIVDSAFVDNIKDVTGLDVTVFTGDKRVATTFLAPDGKSRFVGTTESNEKVTDTVLDKGEVFVGASRVLNQPYYVVYSPLKTLDDKVIGMLFMGKPQSTLFETAQNSLRNTFLVSVVLMVLSIVPAYLLSRYMKSQIEA